jgi:hypothetical protein
MVFYSVNENELASIENIVTRVQWYKMIASALLSVTATAWLSWLYAADVSPGMDAFTKMGTPIALCAAAALAFLSRNEEKNCARMIETIKKETLPR